MKTHVFPLDFVNNGGSLFIASDPKLFEMVKAFAKENITQKVDFSAFRKMWVAARVDKRGNPVRITGLTGCVIRPDIPLFRAIESAATKCMADRLNDYFADQGMRGGDVFIYIAKEEAEEKRCPDYKKWLNAVGAQDSERMTVTVR